MPTAYLFAHDLLGEGDDVVLGRLRGAGLDGVAMAAAYHHSRDVFPHNPRHHVLYLEGGTVYFHPQHERYAGTPLQPKVASVAEADDPLARLTAAAAPHGMAVSAWVVFLHNSRLGFLHPASAPANAFGDPILNYLCPARPEVRAYARALAGDVARYGVESIKLEALSYMPFDHGYHHERSFIRLSPTIRYLLGLCFCDACLGAARVAAVDGARVGEYVRGLVSRVFESSQNETWESDVDEVELRAACDGELGQYLDVRRDVVTSLVQEVTAAVHDESPRTRVVFLDPSGATLGYATGRPTSEATATSIAWRDGVSLPAVAGASDGLGALAYFADPGRFEREVAAYLATLPPGRQLEVVLRPMAPDVDAPTALADRVATLRRLGVADSGFYHYGFMRLESLDWIAQAVGARAA